MSEKEKRTGEYLGSSKLAELTITFRDMPNKSIVFHTSVWTVSSYNTSQRMLILEIGKNESVWIPFASILMWQTRELIEEEAKGV